MVVEILMTFGSGRWRLNLGASGRLRTFDNVMFGAAGAAAAGSYIPEPSVSKAVVAILAVFSGYAGWAYNRGGCLAVHRSWTGQYWVWHYYGGSCR